MTGATRRHVCRGWSAAGRPFGPLRLPAAAPADAAAEYARAVYRLHGVRVPTVAVDGTWFTVALEVRVQVRPLTTHHSPLTTHHKPPGGVR